MKVYNHVSGEGYTNSYTILNDDETVKEAIVIDPGKITMDVINLIEDGGYVLTAVLITHAHARHIQGLRTLCRIYTPVIYAADTEIRGLSCFALNGDGIIRIAGLDVEHFSVPGHSIDSMIYKIEDLLFTGDTLISGVTGSTLNVYSHKMLCSRIKDKIFSLPDSTIVLPGHGCPGTIGSERQFNIDIL